MIKFDYVQREYTIGYLVGYEPMPYPPKLVYGNLSAAISSTLGYLVAHFPGTRRGDYDIKYGSPYEYCIFLRDNRVANINEIV